jgi:hypothetical protein
MNAGSSVSEAAVETGFPLPKGLHAVAAASPVKVSATDISSTFGLNEAAHIAFLRVSGRSGGGDRRNFGNGTDVWVILETDRSVPILGPNGPYAVAATYCWSFVTVDLTPLDGLCVSYGDAVDVPTIP